MKHRYLLVLLGLFIMAGADQPSESKEEYCKEVRQTVREDLNFDGKPEKITFISTSKRCRTYSCCKAKLIIDGDSVSHDVEFDSSYQVVDIDKSDRIREVSVLAEGPSEFDEYYIYWFDGKKIRARGKIFNWEPEFPGDGTVYISTMLEFFDARQKYVLDRKTGELTRVPQTYYAAEVDYQTEKNERIPLFETPEFVQQVEEVRPERKYKVLLCKLNQPSDSSKKVWRCDAYLIRSETGIIGWTKDVPIPRH